MRPTLRQLEYAVAVADHQHFGRAAEAVAVSQPGLSSQIRELERRLGVTLFERAPGHVGVTPAGAELIERARAILRSVDDLTVAVAPYQHDLRGLVRVAAIPTLAPYLLPAVVRAIRSRWPAARLDLHELQSAPMVAGLERGSIDLGLLATPYDTGSLTVEPLADEPFVLAVPAGHELCGDAPYPLAELRALPLLVLPEGHCLRDHALDACDLAEAAEGRSIHAATLATLTQMVAADLGVTLLPASSLPLEARPGTGIAVRPIEDPAPGRTIALAWRPSDPRHEQYRELVADLRPVIAELVRTIGR